MGQPYEPGGVRCFRWSYSISIQTQLGYFPPEGFQVVIVADTAAVSVQSFNVTPP